MTPFVVQNTTPVPYVKTSQKKICLLGDFAVGKTSLVRRYVKGRFDDPYLSTIGVQISAKTVDCPTKPCNLLLWDLAGGDEYAESEAGYIRGAAGAIIVADLTRSATIATMQRYIQQIRTINPRSALVLVGNKSDLAIDRELYAKAWQALTAEWRVPAVLTSAKTGVGVEEAFYLLVNQMEQ